MLLTTVFPLFSNHQNARPKQVPVLARNYLKVSKLFLLPYRSSYHDQALASLHLHPFFLPKRVKPEITPKKGKTTWGINQKLEPASELGSGMRSGSWKRFLGPLTTRLVDLCLFANPPQTSSLPLVIGAPPNEIYGLQYTELFICTYDRRTRVQHTRIIFN